MNCVHHYICLKINLIRLIFLGDFVSCSAKGCGEMQEQKLATVQHIVGIHPAILGDKILADDRK